MALQHDEKLSEPEDHFDAGYDMDIPQGIQVGNTFAFYLENTEDPFVIQVLSIDEYDTTKEITIDFTSGNYEINEVSE